MTQMMDEKPADDSIATEVNSSAAEMTAEIGSNGDNITAHA